MEYLTSSEVANLLGKSKRAVNYMCGRGEFPGAVKDGYRWQIPASCVKTKVGNGKETIDNRPIGIGKQDFESLRKTNCLYIDKTLFIKEWWEQQADITLITRPRRFGKTLNLSMMECFFSLRYHNRKDLFEGLNIWKYSEYRDLQGSFPTIHLSFAKVKEMDYQNAYIAVCQIIRELYITYGDITEKGRLSKEEASLYRETMEALKEAKQTPLVSNSLNVLSQLLFRYYGKKIIILVDEYDTPMQEAFVGGYWDEMSVFIRALFNATFKSNPYIERGMITGITRTSKESIFSDMNNPDVITTMTTKYMTAFGFTQEEVFTAMDMRGVGSEENKEAVKRWYDGFTFGTCTDIYNPWSIINYLDKGQLLNYWANTSSNTLISRLLCQANPDIKEEFKDLLEGKSIHKVIDDQIVFDQLEKREDALWSLLVASGYLKVQNVVVKGTAEADLSLTNMEVLTMFETMVSGWFQEEQYGYNGFIKALFVNDEEAMNTYMNKIVSSVFSAFDVEKREPEKFYHGFVLGLLVELRNRYEVRSNRESGFGRYDVMLMPHKGSDNAYIFEFKVRNPKREKSLEETVSSALAQMEEKRYEEELLNLGIDRERIYKYGFAFEGKQVLIGSRKRLPEEK